MRYQLVIQENLKNKGERRSGKSANDPHRLAFHEGVKILSRQQEANQEHYHIRANLGNGGTNASDPIPKAAPEEGSSQGQQRGTGQEPDPETPEPDIVEAPTL